ncbi:hypothetical protein [Spongiimicrobium salis]|uniref:hypothetical protein n=1 Tax=Spongiimicrobium salis TaxID=1667022 RepID=UPI00374D9E51
MKLYQAQIVQDLRAFYGDILLPATTYTSVYDYLNGITTRMWEGFQARNAAIAVEINNYHPSYLGWPVPEIFALNFTLADCKHTVANQYGFADWTIVKQQNQSYDLEFETAVNNLLEGNLEGLEGQLKAAPQLVNHRSQFGHRATLLHYAGNNGVELWRQQIPHNLAEGIRLLLQYGADKEATMPVYGGQFTTEQLLKTSAHPNDCGLMGVLSAAFED